MLSEEALILYATGVGFGLLALGVWRLLVPSRSRLRPPDPPDTGTSPPGPSRAGSSRQGSRARRG